jgi:SAM-dependent methyltransferase
VNRSDWLRERRRLTEERFDHLFAPIYDDDWGASISPSHQRCLEKFLDLCPPGSLILDAACGTGKYWPLILARGCRVFGVDQSQVMLVRARDKFPDVPTEKVGLQELAYQAAFDAAICMDAMEYVFPEDWLPVLHNFRRAIRSDGYFYFTVEIAAEADIKQAFLAAQEQGLPVVYGEWALEGGYHYYPSIAQVRTWIAQAQFHLIGEASGDDYYHLLIRR